VHRNNNLLYKSQQDAHVTEFILSDNCSTCFRRHYHPSSGAQATVNTASGNRYTVLLSAAIVEELEQFQLIHDSSRQQYGYIHYLLFYTIYCIFRKIYLIKNNCNFNQIYRYSLSVNLTLSITV
jgi:hypothetical protein